MRSLASVGEIFVVSRYRSLSVYMCFEVEVIMMKELPEIDVMSEDRNVTRS